MGGRSAVVTAAVLAGVLVLAGCGDGSRTDPETKKMTASSVPAAKKASGKPAGKGLRTSEEVAEDFRTASIGVGVGYTAMDAPPAWSTVRWPGLSRTRRPQGRAR
ncbi:hypothetical protein ABT354_30455 [Streptomyces sp. NPDC000594]|uniref:hypothetical protein n=1 Tax=Streptomyces sp. NPDC000594 TaxID=3154261 RepID=UPI0033169043